MAVQTYCVQADVESIMSVGMVERFIDDDETTAITSTETSYVTDAIERAATKINAYLATKYILSDLASNGWCKWCNASIAAVFISERRGNGVSEALQRDYEDCIELLQDIQKGVAVVPEAPAPFFPGPYVSVMRARLWSRRGEAKIRVDTSLSTGPASDLKRNIT